MHSNDPETARDALSIPIPSDRALVPFRAARGERPGNQTMQRANAAFLASLVASDINAETVRSRRRAEPGHAIACYRAALARTAA